MTNLTTLQLAEQIARAVVSETALNAYDVLGRIHYEPLTQAVLATLRKHGCWFCRLTETAHGTEQMRLEL